MPKDRARAAFDFNNGTLVSDRYRVIRHIGKGGYGVVYEVEHLELGKRFALKVLNLKRSEEKEKMERFRREAISTSKIAHPNIVSVTDFGTTSSGRVYYVMELLHGHRLSSILKRKGMLSFSRALPILAATCHALHEAHKVGVVHRDMKPSNIFITPAEDIQRGTARDFVKILDFGLAKVMESSSSQKRLTADGQALGTLGYIAPELLKGEQVDYKADIYSLGCTAFEMFSGRPVFVGNPIEVANAHVQTPPPRVLELNPAARMPEQMEAIIARCLRKDPDSRYPSLNDMLEDLRELARTMLTPEGHTWVGAYEARQRKLKPSDSWDVNGEESFWWENLPSGSIELDKLPTSGESVDASPQPPPSPEAHNYVLLVESDRSLSGYIKRELAEHGYQVKLAEGRQAVDIAKATPPGLILLSVELPDISGYAVCSRLKKQAALKNVPVILMSFDETDEVFKLHQRLPLHAESYLVKPFSGRELLGEVEKLFGTGEREMKVSQEIRPQAHEFSYEETTRVGKRAIGGIMSGSTGRILVIVLALVTALALGLTIYVEMSRHEGSSDASLVIHVDPPGAQVRLDGAPLDKRGAVRLVNDLRTGWITLEATHPSCKADNRRIQLKHGQTSLVRIELKCGSE
jgi:serine/threonine protein kinase